MGACDSGQEEEEEAKTNHALISSFHSAGGTGGETQVPPNTNTSIQIQVSIESLCLQLILGIVGKMPPLRYCVNMLNVI